MSFREIQQTSRLGWSVSGAGDINGDGIDDLIIGARYGEIAGGPADSGSAYVLYGRADRAFGVNAKQNGEDANIKEGDDAYAGLETTVRKVVFVSDIAMAVSPDTGTPAAGLGTGADDMFTLASTTSGAGGGVKHHNGRKGIDTLKFTEADGTDASLVGTLDFTEDTDGTGTSDTLGNAYNRFDSIEVIDIMGNGAQTLILSEQSVYHMTELRNGFEGTSGKTTILLRVGAEDMVVFQTGETWTEMNNVMVDTDGDDTDETWHEYILDNARILANMDIVS